jgi:hypothetical protein
MSLDMRGSRSMMTLNKIVEHVGAEPFRPFRISMASGQSYEIRHPERILVGRSSVRVYQNGEHETIPHWQDLSMLLMESIEPIPAPSAKP